MGNKKTNCIICGHSLNLEKRNVYEVIVDYDTPDNLDIFNATDCPNCGCQNLLQKRYEKVVREENERCLIEVGFEAIGNIFDNPELIGEQP